MTTEKTKRLVLVHWVDSCSPSRKWQDPSEAKTYKRDEAETVGWLLRKDKDTVLLASSMSSEQIGDLTAIPTGAVLSIVSVTPTHRRPK